MEGTKVHEVLKDLIISFYLSRSAPLRASS
jgi:hypothetical protein